MSGYEDFSSDPPEALSTGALTAETGFLQEDPRRQPLMSPEKIHGVVPPNHFGAQLPETIRTGPQFIDRWIFPALPPVPPTCFAPGSPITLADGSTAAIESLQVGDEVLALDEATGELRPARVSETFIHAYEGPLHQVNGLWMTPNHPMLVDGEWTEAAHVGEGAGLIELVRGGSLELLPSRAELMPTKHFSGTVYNLEVEGLHTYFAGGVLVHNKDDPENQQGQMP